MMYAIPEQFLCSQGNLTLSKFESSKRSHKGQYQTRLICWCEEHPPLKVTASYKQYQRSYCIHMAAWPWTSLKGQKSHTKINIKLIRYCDVENTTIKVQLDRGNLRRVITSTRSIQTLYTWKFKKVTQRSTSNLAEILKCRTSLPVQLQYDAGKFWGIIIFTRNCKMLPFEHDLVQKVKIEPVRNFDVENIPVKVFTRQPDLESVGKFKKMNVVQDFYVENIPIKLQHDTGNLWRVNKFSRYRMLSASPPRQRQYPFSVRGWGKTWVKILKVYRIKNKFHCPPPQKRECFVHCVKRCQLWTSLKHLNYYCKLLRWS